MGIKHPLSLGMNWNALKASICVFPTGHGQRAASFGDNEDDPKMLGGGHRHAN